MLVAWWSFVTIVLLKSVEGAQLIGESTIYCQQAVYKDAQDSAYNAINKPVNVDNFTDLEQYGETFAGVTPVVLEPGVVTPEWLDSDGGTRGEAVLWVPDGVSRGSPRLLYVHGGGWLAGSPSTDGYAPFGAKMARLYGMPVLVIDYTLAPIGNFSAIIQEVGMATNFLATHEPTDLLLGNQTELPVADAPPIFISGDSSGGGSALSALVAQASPDGLPKAEGAKLAGGVVFSPWINLESNGPTYYTELFGLHEKGNVLIGDIYFGVGATPEAIVQANQDNAKLYSADLQDPVANPFYAPDEWLRDLAPVSLHVGMSELLQSDITLFATKAAKAGARRVESHLFDGMWHVFQMYSDGCGSGLPLVLAESSLNFSKQFYERTLSEMSLGLQFGNGGFCSVPHYEYPLGQDSAQGIACV